MLHVLYLKITPAEQFYLTYRITPQEKFRRDCTFKPQIIGSLQLVRWTGLYISTSFLRIFTRALVVECACVCVCVCVCACVRARALGWVVSA